MFKSITGSPGALVLPALALTVLVLAGCGHDKDATDQAGDTAAVADPAVVGSSADPALPTGVLPASSLPAGGAADAVPPVAGAPVPAATARAGELPSHLGSEVEALRPAWIEATVTRGGSGPCYGLRGADGINYAAYAAKPVKLAKGARIHVQLTLGSVPAGCGSGEQARMGGLQLAG